MRRGIATTEFWATVVAAVGGLAASLSGVLAPRYAAIAASVAVGCYSIGRGLAKLAAGGVQQAQAPTPAPSPQPVSAPPVAEPPPVAAPPVA